MDCRICGKETVPYLRLSTAELDEPFLDAELRSELPELELRQCCGCLCAWASDARKLDGILARAYERVSDSYFDSEENDPRYVQFYRNLEQLVTAHVAGRTILDVGCGDGVFLSTLSDEWSKQGLEPSRSGATRAQKKNLEVACGTLDNTRGQYQVDLISVLDVIEHVIDPHHFVESFKPHLRPGGAVLLLTGDAGSYPAKLAGPRWSYLRWSGHVSIFSQAGLQRLLELHGFEICAWKRCEHPASSGALAWWRVHLLEPARRVFGRNKSWYPFWRDHQAVIARLKA